jgi:hypothetical protein
MAGIFSALWTGPSKSDVHDTGRFAPCAPLEEEPDMNDRSLGLGDTTMPLDREGRSSSLGAKQAEAKLHPATATLSQFDDPDDSDDLIREAGLCLIDMELTEPYDDSVDFFSWRTSEIPAPEERD